MRGIHTVTDFQRSFHMMYLEMTLNNYYLFRRVTNQSLFTLLHIWKQFGKLHVNQKEDCEACCWRSSKDNGLVNICILKISLINFYPSKILDFHYVLMSRTLKLK